MGNGAPIKLCDYCSPKEELQQGDAEIEKNGSGDANLKTIDIIKKDTNANRIEPNINSSMHETIAKFKINTMNKSDIQNNSNSPHNYYSTNNNTNIIQTNKNTSLYNSHQTKKNSLKSLEENNNNNININDTNHNSINNGIPKTKLILSGELFHNSTIEINEKGMKNSTAKKNNESVIFGIKSQNPKHEDYNSSNAYDYLVDNLQNKEATGKIFKIYYDKNKRIYILKFMNYSLILYYKINDLVYFDTEKDYYLIIGDIFLTINAKKSSNKKEINIQVEVDKDKAKKYTYTKEDMPINIGRTNCNINIQRHSISKIHSFICFSKEKDLFYYRDAKSTNGSSLLIREDDCINIKGEMHFRLEDLPFKIKEIKNDDEKK